MYYSIRLTIATIHNITEEEVTDSHISQVLHLVAELIQHKAEGEYITCLEKTDKLGERTAKHIHFNFSCDQQKSTVRQFIVRKAESLGISLNSVTKYALSGYPEPDDYSRWYRYCMKEKYLPKYTKFYESAHSHTLEQMIIMAKDERKRAIESNRKNRAKNLEKSTLYDKMCATLKGKTHKDISIEMYKYYVEEKKPVNSTTIGGYVNTYMLQENLISYEEFYRKNNP